MSIRKTTFVLIPPSLSPLLKQLTIGIIVFPIIQTSHILLQSSHCCQSSNLFFSLVLSVVISVQIVQHTSVLSIFSSLYQDSRLSSSQLTPHLLLVFSHALHPPPPTVYTQSCVFLSYSQLHHLIMMESNYQSISCENLIWSINFTK